MTIAVTYENGQVFGHFGHTAFFKFYEVENDAILSSKVLSTNGQGHGALADFLKENAANLLICGGIGPGAQMALQNIGIELYAGIAGDTDEAVKALLAGTLPHNTAANCDHHHDGEAHTCGEHGCGNHGCGHHE